MGISCNFDMLSKRTQIIVCKVIYIFLHLKYDRCTTFMERVVSCHGPCPFVSPSCNLSVCMSVKCLCLSSLYLNNPLKYSLVTWIECSPYPGAVQNLHFKSNSR